MADFNDLHKIEHFQRLQCFTDLLNTTISLRAAEVSKRQYSHWKKEGLVNSGGTERGWVKLNLYDYLWVKIVQELRTFGVSLPVIKTIKEHLYASSRAAVTKKSVKKVNAMISSTFPGITELNKDVQLSEADLQDIIADPKNTLPYFTAIGTAVSRFLLNGDEVYIMVLRVNEHIIPLLYSGSWEGKNREYSRYTQIRIPIHELLKTYFTDPAKKRFASIFRLLSKEEAGLYDLATGGQMKSVEIVPFSGDPEILTATKKTTSEDISTRIYGTLIKKEYKEILLHLKNSRTIKLKNRMMKDKQK